MRYKYEYNIAFYFENGTGTAQFDSSKKINSNKDINEMAIQIEKKHDIKNITISNFQLLRKRRIG